MSRRRVACGFLLFLALLVVLVSGLRLNAQEPPSSDVMSDLPVAEIGRPEFTITPEQLTVEERERLLQDALSELWRYIPGLETPHLKPLPPLADNGKIAYVNTEGYLYLMNPDGTAQRNLVDELSDIGWPTWSHDSRYLAFVADGESGRCLYKLRLDTQPPSRLVCGFVSMSSLEWSPQDTRIVFFGKREADSDYHTWALSADGSKLRELAPGLDQTWHPTWLDENRAVFPGEAPTDVWRLYTVDFDAPNDPSPITPEFRCKDPCSCAGGEIWAGWPDASPDGQKIAFVGGRTEGDKYSCEAYYAVYVVNPASSSPPSKIIDVADTSSGTALAGGILKWASDNRRVGLYAGGSDAVLRLNIVDTIDRTLTLLRGREGGSWYGFDWSPDATRLVAGHRSSDSDPEIGSIDPNQDTFTLLAHGRRPAWGTVPPGPPVDLEVTGVEVTQAIQRQTGPHIPLVQGKETWVRIYARSSPRDVENVTARLYLTRGSEQKELREPVNKTITVRTDGGDRGEENHTFNFRLPADWITGTVGIRAEVSPDRKHYEENYDNNMYPRSTQPPQTLVFKPTDAVTIHSWRFHFIKPDGSHHVVSAQEVEKSLPFIRKTYPIAATLPALVDHGEIGPIYSANYDLTQDNDWVKLLERIPCDVSRIGSDRCFGWIPEAVQPVPSPRWGRAASPKAAATVGYGGLAAHELAHTYGADDSGCRQINEYGFWGNEEHQIVYRPQDYYDFMNPKTSCGMLRDNKQWVSTWVYEGKLMNRLMSDSTALRARQVNRVTEPYLEVSGIITPGLGVRILSLGTVTRTVGFDDEVGTGLYRVELQNTSGELLFTRYFTPTIESGHEGPHVHYFQQVMPRPAETAQLAVWDADKLLRLVTVTANSPEVSILTSLDGIVLEGIVEVTWTASDADGDVLHYRVEYSPDGGTSWSTLAVNLNQQALLINADNLQGTTQGKIRVLASDGLNTATALSSGFFVVADKVPSISILSPQDGTRVRPGIVINLVGTAYDREDRVLSGSSLVWGLDGNMVIGTGEQAAVEGLSYGPHTLTLTATDSQGNQASASVDIQVGFVTYLPIMMRNE